MGDRKSYDQHLRVIGQSLEAKRISVFELKSQEDQYIVRGEPEKDDSLMGRLRAWQERLRAGSPSPVMHFTVREIERLNREARTRRARADRLPDFYSLADTLRTVGSYLDEQGAVLMEVHKRPLSLTLLYRKKDGHPNMEERTIASFYELFLALHRRRIRKSGRHSA
ncbi:MAG TPA: hypothetical protein VE131_02145 [Terriglobales bacterium]|jgi:hypothetical protein|nr:hypothetical protein [Terriglobales bacterium]